MISIIDNFDYKGKLPNFSRDQFNTKADMAAFSENYLPDVFIAICLEDGLQYKFERGNEVDPETGKWRPLSSGGAADLTSYYTKNEINTKLEDYVEKELGKQLSTEDYTTAEKTKLAGLENYDDTTLDSRITANENAITTLNGNSSVLNSVDYKVAAGVSEAQTYTDTECAKKVDKVVGKQLSTEDYTTAEKTKLAGLENYDDTALAARVTANEDAIDILNGDTTVNGSVDKKVASCLSDSKDYTDVSIQNAIRQTAIVCDAKPTISGTTITYVQDGVTKVITSDNKTKFYYTDNSTNYSTIWIEEHEFTDTIASVNFSDYVSKSNDVVSTYTGSDADKTKIPSIASMDALKTLVDTDLADKVNVSDVESSISSSSDNPVKSSALYTKFAEKVDITQGVANEGKILQVDSNGELILVNPQSTIDLSDCVSKTNDVASTYTGLEVDTSKVTNLGALNALKTLVDTDLATKVNTSDIDSALSSSSENPVQNKVVKESLDTKLDISQGIANAGKVLKVDANGDIALADTSALGSSAESISYENASYSSLDNVKKAIDNILAKIYYVEPKINTFTMTPATDKYEIGTTVSSITFEWTYNKDIISQSLTDCTLTASDTTATYDGTITANKTFTLTASDGTNSVSASKTISFMHKIYYGASSTTENFDSAFILGLSNKEFASSFKRKYVMDIGNNEYGYVCYPSAWGTINSWWIGGFEVTTSDCGTIAFTNASGNTTTFRITRTSKSGLGNITAEVK